MSPDKDEFREDDEHEDYASRSIFAAGWFRAVLVLTVLAIVVVVSLPYLLNWFEPTPPATQAPPAKPPATQAQKAEPGSTMIPSPTTPTAPPTPAPAPVTPPKATPDRPTLPPPPATAAKPAPQVSPPKPVETVQRAKEPTVRAPRPAPAPSAAGGSYWVQVGLFKDQRNAEALAKTLREAGFAVEVAQVTRSGSLAGTYHVVRAGGFPDRARALAARDELKAKGHVGFLTQGPAK